jgi:hypothetical protein
MGIRIYLIVFFLLSLNLYSSNNTYFNNIKKNVSLKENEQLVVIYQDIGSCVKCYLQPMDQIAKLAKEGRIKNFKLLALVRCDRDLELSIYKKQHDWKYYMYRDDGKGHKRLNAKETTFLSVFDYNGKKIYEME